MWHRPGFSIRKRWVAVGLAAVAAAVAATACAGGDLQTYAGVIQQVDSISGTAVVTMKDGSTISVDLSQIPLQTIQTAIGSATLDQGAPVTVSFGADHHVEKIGTHQAEADGTIIALDPVAESLTLKTEHGQSLTVTITPDTKIEEPNVEGQGTFDQLAIGMGVQVDYQIDTMEAVKVEANDGSSGDSHEGKEGARLRENHDERGLHNATSTTDQNIFNALSGQHGQTVGNATETTDRQTSESVDEHDEDVPDATTTTNHQTPGGSAGEHEEDVPHATTTTDQQTSHGTPTVDSGDSGDAGGSSTDG